MSRPLFPAGKEDGRDESIRLAVSGDSTFPTLDIEENPEKVRGVSVLVERF